MFLIPHKPIKIASLPKSSRTPQLSIDGSRSERFPASKQIFQGMFWILNQEGMDMIRHNDRRDQRKPLPIEMAKCIIDNSSTLDLPQNARPVTGVEPALNRHGEASVIFLLGLSVPRFRMKSQPDLTLIFPFRA